MKMFKKVCNSRRGSERGVSLFLVAMGLMMLLGVAGLAIDLATLYVARNEAQRAADAAALAGAKEFALGNISAAPGQSSQVGNQNLVMGRSPDLDPENIYASCPPPTGESGGCLNLSVSNDPRITIVVYKRLPTYFIKLFGITSVPVSATATAEAYTAATGSPGSVSGPSVSVSCAKPWLMSNCDYDHPDTSVPYGSPTAGVDNPNCPILNSQGNPSGGYYEYFLYNGTVLNNTAYNPNGGGGAIGEPLMLKIGSPAQAVSASQFLPVFFPNQTTGSMAGVTYTCPSCASSDENSASNNNNSAALYSENIECCSSVTLTCGNTPINPVQGNMVGPTGSGVDCLIHEQSGGGGQDCFSFDPSAPTTCPGAAYSVSLPFTMYAGTVAGPNYDGVPEGTPIQTSDSMVTVPLYPGQLLCPGNSCPSGLSVDTVGFLTVFITSVGSPNQTVYGNVMEISPCQGDTTGSGGSGSGTPIPAPTGSTVPIRLIHN